MAKQSPGDGRRDPDAGLLSEQRQPGLLGATLGTHCRRSHGGHQKAGMICGCGVLGGVLGDSRIMMDICVGYMMIYALSGVSEDDQRKSDKKGGFRKKQKKASLPQMKARSFTTHHWPFITADLISLARAPNFSADQAVIFPLKQPIVAWKI